MRTSDIHLFLSGHTAFSYMLLVSTGGLSDVTAPYRIFVKLHHLKALKNGRQHSFRGILILRAKKK
jgi:hypothetical protein